MRIEKMSEELVEAVWCKGAVIPGKNHNIYRKDMCGATMHRDLRNRENIYAWEIDHINPNGPTQLYNLRPLQWENNLEKGDSPDGSWKCKVDN